jgi:hypothetical protein
VVNNLITIGNMGLLAIGQPGLGKLIIKLTWQNSQIAMWTLQFGKVDLENW